jgi:PAP2 superfamily C-terminal
MNSIRRYWEECRSTWLYHGSNNTFRLHFAVTIIGFLAFLRWGIGLISSFEDRQGRILSDPVLQALPPIDFSLPIFALIHPSIIFTAIHVMRYPVRFLLGMQACLIILLMRTLSIYLVPLEPPPGIILLEDPFLSVVFGSAQNVAVKDLFFSGHVATLCILYYVSRNRYWKNYLIGATVLVSVLIAWQHVHYTLDIVTAPVFAFLCWNALELFHKHSPFGILQNPYSFDLDKAR